MASPPHPPRAEPRPPPAPADDFEAELAALRPRRHLLRTTGRVGAVLLLVATAATAGIYAYDRTLLSDEFPGLSEWLPSLFPPPAPPTGAVPSVAAPVPSAKAAPTASVASPDESASAAPPTELFDRRAAVAALTIAAESARSCYDPSSRIYGGMVIATFAPDGKVTKIDLRGPLADTSVGACVAKIFERAHIPPFLGEPVPVAHQVPLR